MRTVPRARDGMQKGPRSGRARPVAAAARPPMGGKPARTMTALDGNGEHPRTRNKRAGRTLERGKSASGIKPSKNSWTKLGIVHRPWTEIGFVHRFRAETGGPSHPMAWQSHNGDRRIPGHEAERIQKSRTWLFRTYAQSRFLASTYAQSRFLAAGARRERAAALRLERTVTLPSMSRFRTCAAQARTASARPPFRPPSETATPLSHTSKSRSRRPDKGSASHSPAQPHRPTLERVRRDRAPTEGALRGESLEALRRS